MAKSSKSNKVYKYNKFVRRAARPAPFADSFATADACFSVEVKDPWGESIEDIEVKIDCGGMIHGDEDTIDLLIDMLEQAKENLVARRGKLTSRRSIRWKCSTGDFVDSHCGFWHITPIYGGLTRPESYELWFGASTRRRVGSGQTQRECKAVAEDMYPGLIR